MVCGGFRSLYFHISLPGRKPVLYSRCSLLPVDVEDLDVTKNLPVKEKK